MHRATSTAIRSLVLTHELREHVERSEALGQAVPVTAMGGRDHVARTKGPARTYGRSLLTCREMDESWNLTVAVEPGHPVLEASNQ